MSEPTEDRLESTRSTIDPAVMRWIGSGAVVLIVVGTAAFLYLRGAHSDPGEPGLDPFLATGREVYLSRCASCHGTTGRGDGPIARALSGPPPGNLTDADWKHGGQPAEVLDVIRNGVSETSMTGFGKYRILDDDEIKAVAAYVFHLAGREVPPEFRER